MPKKKYIVTLTDEERATLKELVNKGKNPAYKVNHARILLLADTNQSEGGWKDRDISQVLSISVALSWRYQDYRRSRSAQYPWPRFSL